LRLLSKLKRRLDSTRLSTPNRASPAFLLLNWNLYKWRTTSRVWCVNSIGRGVFIGVPRAITNSIKSVIHQVLASRPSHVVGQPWVAASMTPGIKFHSTAYWRASPPRKHMGGCKVGLASQGVWPADHPLGPHVSGLRTQPSRIRCIPGWTLILVEFHISL
jgi:hypothetical protein